MLILRRKVGESIYIVAGDIKIRIEIDSVRTRNVALAIDAPKGVVKIHRDNWDGKKDEGTDDAE